MVEGTLVDRKLNVAITRARQQFVLVGHRQVLAGSPIYRKMWDRMTPYDE
jgi:superfamily I DNA and/or RNA helicase